MRALHWLLDLADKFDSALDWQEADDLLLEAPALPPTTGWPQDIDSELATV